MKELHPAPHPSYPVVLPPREDDDLPAFRLLIVDDDPLIRELDARVLILSGYEVQTAPDGAVALEMLAAEKFDLVITDRHMPRLDGASMVLAIRSAGSQVPIIMVSTPLPGKPLPAEVARQLCAIIPKPARSHEILAACAKALRPTRQESSAALVATCEVKPYVMPTPTEREPQGLAGLGRKLLAATAVIMRPLSRESAPQHPKAATTTEQLVIRRRAVHSIAIHG